MTTQKHSGSGDNVAGDKNVKNVYVSAPPQPLTEIPQNIPYLGTEIFVGRVKDLENIDKLLGNNQPLAITSVTGMGGVGKTELAVQYALRYQQNYSGGICWIEAKRSDLMGQIVSFCQSIDINPPDYLKSQKDKLNYCWNHWIEGNVLLIFDDVQTYNNIKQSLPPKNNNFKVIVTSRQKLGRLQQLRLQVLKPAEALELLRQIVGEERVNNELETVQELCRWLGYLPLGLELVGRYIYNDEFISIEETLELLKAEKLKSEPFLNPDEDEGDMTAKLGVAAAFKLSWDKLSTEGQKLGCYLSLFGAELFDWSWVESSDVYDVQTLTKARRDDLLKYNLLQLNKEEDRDKPLLSYHPLVYQYFADKFQELEDREELKYKFYKSLIPVARSIGDTPTLKEIKKFTIAVPHLEMIATAMRDNIEDEDICQLFIGLGRFYEEQSNYQEAEKWWKDCLSVFQERFEEEHEYITTSMNNLALLYYSQGKYEAAQPLLMDALAMRKKLLGEKHPSVAQSMNNWALLYYSQGKYEAAEPFLVDALAMRKKLLGEEHPDVAQSMNTLAELYRIQGKYEAAEPLSVDALAMRKKLLGEEHPSVAQSMNTLAELYRIQGKYEAAEPLYVDALAVCKKLLGEEHPSVAQSMNNLAALYHSQGKYEAAEPLLMDALAMWKKLLGEKHPNVALSMNNLAVLYRTQGKYKAAEPLFVDALAMRKRLLGEEHPDVALSINNLAKLYYSQGKYEAAEPLFVDALAMRKKLLGEEHPDVAQSMDNLALLYKTQGKYEAAELLYQQAIKIYETILGNDHPWTIIVRNNYQIMLNEIS